MFAKKKKKNIKIFFQLFWILLKFREGEGWSMDCTHLKGCILRKTGFCCCVCYPALVSIIAVKIVSLHLLFWEKEISNLGLLPKLYIKYKLMQLFALCRVVGQISELLSFCLFDESWIPSTPSQFISACQQNICNSTCVGYEGIWLWRFYAQKINFCWDFEF